MTLFTKICKWRNLFRHPEGASYFDPNDTWCMLWRHKAEACIFSLHCYNNWPLKRSNCILVKFSTLMPFWCLCHKQLPFCLSNCVQFSHFKAILLRKVLEILHLSLAKIFDERRCLGLRANWSSDDKNKRIADEKKESQGLWLVNQAKSSHCMIHVIFWTISAI